MIKNIYDQLSFKPLREAIYPNAVIDEAKQLFSELPLKNIRLRQLVVEPTILEEALAISTAEDSELTPKNAKAIQLSPDITARLKKYRENTSLAIREKYDQLEFENIKDVELNTASLSFPELSTGLLCDLHYHLTVGLDEYAHALGISRYHTGELRRSNSIKVGKIRQYIPPNHKKIPELLKNIFKEFSGREKIHLTDILEFHILLYAIHPFANGNKRVCRIIESLLLNHYGYSAERTLSLSIYYGKKAESYNFFLIESLRRRDVQPFINFGIQGYFYAGIVLFNENLKRYILDEYTQRFIALTQIKSKPSKTQQYYSRAAKAIIGLGGIFTHKQFTDKMKNYGLGLGVSQEILKFLKKESLIRHQGRIYFIEKAREINKFHEESTKFLMRNHILIED